MSHVGTTSIKDTGFHPYFDESYHKFQTHHKPSATFYYGGVVATDPNSPPPHYYSHLRPKEKRSTGHWLYTGHH